MAQINSKIMIQLVWLKEETDHRLQCSACGDVICGDMNMLLLAPKTENIRMRATMADFVLCDSCRDLVEINK